MTAATDQITILVDHDTHSLLLNASVATGYSDINSFALNAAIEKAKQVIKTEHPLRLSAADSMSLMEALDKPPEANTKLQAAFNSYRRV